MMSRLLDDRLLIMGVAFTVLLPTLPSRLYSQDGEAKLMIPMQLEIQLDSPQCVLFENFTFKVRILNPNPFEVTLPGFNMGYIEPEVHVRGPDGEYHRLYYGAMDSAWTPVPVTIAPKGKIERHRFLYSHFNHERWPNEPGVFTLRGKTQISSGRLVPDGEDILIDWEIPQVTVRVEPNSFKDRQAMDFLKLRMAANRNEQEKKSLSAFRARIFSEFLDQFVDSAYAPEIRWELVGLLPEAIGERQSPLYKDPKMKDLLEECLTFCLDRGGAYAEDFVSWNKDRIDGGRAVLEFALINQRPALLKLAARKIDEKYPDDKAGKLYRQVLVKSMTGTIDEARAVATELSERFPETAYAREVSGFLENLERQRRTDGDAP